MSENREIPDPIKREVRQRCGFGCVMCGLPIYEYEHMEGWANVKRHIADEITLLCPNHHAQKTKGLIPVEKIKEADKNPYNIVAQESEKLDLHYEGDQIEVIIGNTRYLPNPSFKNSMIPIIIDRNPIIEVVTIDNQIFLNLNLYDEKNTLILKILENQLSYKVDIWDIEFEGKTLTIRQASRNILIVIEFETPNKIKFTKGRILYNNCELTIKEKEVKINGVFQSIGENLTLTGRIGMKIGKNMDDLPGLISISYE